MHEVFKAFITVHSNYIASYYFSHLQVIIYTSIKLHGYIELFILTFSFLLLSIAIVT